MLMTNAQRSRMPVAATGMLIRKPVAEVFNAFIDPAITTKFWFTKSTGKLEVGKQVTWTWEMYNASTKVSVKAIEPNQRILIEWDGYDAPTQVEWKFEPQPDGSTFVTITDSGFSGDADKIVEQAISSTEGFTFLLAGLKALLEYNINLNLIADRFPKGAEQA
jgi:uncharacterized protein YndB with AHSA1/START domain